MELASFEIGHLLSIGSGNRGLLPSNAHFNLGIQFEMEYLINLAAMLRNHVITSLRRFWKNKTYTSFNILGLAVGFTCVLYIGLYIHSESTYDQFHPQHERIFRLSHWSFALTTPALMEHLAQNSSQVESYAMLLNSGNFIVGNGKERISNSNSFYTTAGFFEVFQHKVYSGSLQSFRDNANAVVITKSAATNFFGQPDVAGRELIIYGDSGETPYLIAAVVDDIPSNTHIKFDIIARIPQTMYDQGRESLANTIYHGYLKTREGAGLTSIREEADRIFSQLYLDIGAFPDFSSAEELMASGEFTPPLLLPVADIHLESHLRFDLEPSANKQYLMVFGFTAIFVLLLASINFINLTTAQSVKRAKEVGIKKTLGSSRKLLIAQFLSESFLLCLLAATLAIGTVELTYKLITQAIGVHLTTTVMYSPLSIVAILAVVLLTALISGIYPAFYLTTFRPARVLKGKLVSGDDSSFFRNSLVTFQFAISIGLGVFVFIVQDQLTFGLQTDPGFQKENLVVVDNSSDQLQDNTETFQAKIAQDSRFISSGYFAYDLFEMATIWVNTLDATDPEDGQPVYYQRTDSDYLSTLGLELVEGRFFDSNRAGDSLSIIINETAVTKLGLVDPVGKEVAVGGGWYNVRIVGVFKDIHHRSFEEKIPPTLFMHDPDWPDKLLVRISAGQTAAKIERLEEIWKEHTLQPFDYEFVDVEFAKLFQKEQQLSKIISMFTGLSIFVACLGLLGLAGFTAEQKTKEIGIRKVLGASVFQILRLFSSRFGLLLLLAACIAFPLTTYLVDMWLNSFAYRVEVSFRPYLLVSMVAIVVIGVTVSYHMLKSALANPVRALKEE